MGMRWGGLFKTRYRVARDKVYSWKWAVQYKLWFWPTWVEWGSGCLDSKRDADELITHLLSKGRS